MNSLLAAQYNTSRVLRQLWLNPGISRAEIADRLGLNRSTLTHIIKGLTDQGLVQALEKGEAGPQGGRKNVRLRIDASFGCFAGLHVEADRVRVVAVDLSGELLIDKEIKARASGKKLLATCCKAYDWVKRYLETVGVPLLGVGFGLAGIVDPDECVIRESIPLDIREPQALGDQLVDRISEPVLIDNDANCGCWGEVIARRSSASSSFLFVLGAWRRAGKLERRDITAIGIGLAIDDNVHRGKDYSAGEFRSIEWMQGRTSQFSLTDKEVAAARSDRRVFIKMTKELARNVALVVNVLDLDQLYLGGFFAEEDAEVKMIFEQEIQRNWSYPGNVACEVRLSTRGESAVAYGAASMFLVRAFSPSDDLILTGHRDGSNPLSRNP